SHSRLSNYGFASPERPLPTTSIPIWWGCGTGTCGQVKLLQTPSIFVSASINPGDGQLAVAEAPIGAHGCARAEAGVSRECRWARSPFAYKARWPLRCDRRHPTVDARSRCLSPVDQGID